MLVIRKQQMNAMARPRTEDFTRRLVDHLRSILPNAVDMEAQVQLGVARGLRFFRTEKDVARYCEIVLVKLGGWTDDDHPKPVLEMLRTNCVPAEHRLRSFERWVTLQGR